MHVPDDLLGADGEPDYLRMILTSRVYDVCRETPCDEAVRLTAKLGVRVLLKREDLQPVFSFKLRGAFNMMAQLPADERWKGVISCSAGNHAQGVAYSAAKLGIPATIVMPRPTPTIKYENVKRLGSTVVLHGDDFDAAKAECARLQATHGLTYIPPFDNPYVIAGQGTIAMEIVRQVNVKGLRAIVCCIGGGGLIAGVAAYAKRIVPHVKIIGVETWDADAMLQSVEAGHIVTLKEVGLFADGTAVKTPGTETFRLARKYVDEIVRVNTDEICAAIKDVFDDTRSVCEPSGALSVAGLRKYLRSHPEEAAEAASSGGSYCAVVSGANMNFDRLRFVAERSQLGAGTEVFFIVEMTERPGSFLQLVSMLQPRQITEFSYRYRRADHARVYISFSVNQDRDTCVDNLINEIEATGMKVWDVSDNTVAKSHARYLVGGAPGLADEHVYRFEFPERPGALIRFLHNLNNEWNVSLFHYRNNGSDVARILAGLQIPADRDHEIEEFLQNLGYPYVDESENLAYKLFL